MDKICVVILILALIPGVSANISANDTVYPSAYDIHGSYLLSSDRVAVSDTFRITRSIKNDESFGLSGFYFSENLPPEFEIVEQNLRVNGLDSGFMFIGPISSHIVEGSSAYYWVIDSRGNLAGADYSIYPGDSISLELKITCDDIGRYTLPNHAAAFYGNGTGFFATSDSTVVDVVLSLDVEDDIPESLPDRYLISTAYPNPFNSAVTVKYSGLGLTGERIFFEVFDVTGRKIFRNNFVSRDNNGYIKWSTDKNISSGVYFYNLTDGSRSSGGKIILLK